MRSPRWPPGSLLWRTVCLAGVAIVTLAASLVGSGSPAQALPTAQPALTSTQELGDSEPQSAHGTVWTVRASRITTGIAIDGRLDDETWGGIEASGAFRQREPDEGRPATEDTQVRVGYDDESLYVAVQLFDRDPSGIERRLSRRDTRGSTDTLTVYLDPYHDHRTGVMFEVSAAGVQRDALIYDDGRTDSTWDAVWYSAVGYGPEGWTVEMRIPFSQLRFVPTNQTWGINVVRYIHRKAEDDWLELVSRDADWLASRMAHLMGLDGIRSSSHFEFIPHGMVRADFVASEPGNPFNDGSRFLESGGLDVKWGATNSLTLDVTFRPDFGQVEVDPSVVNLTEFERFFEERRPFFLGGSQIFRSVAGESLFYSRRIGRPPQGSAHGDFTEPIDATVILGAAKLTGTAGGASFGLLNAVTNRERAASVTDGVRSSTEVEPLANYLVGRFRKDGGRGGVGAMFTATNRGHTTPELRGRLARYAYAASSDGYLYLDGRRDWVFSGQVAMSLFKGDPAAVLRQQRSSRRYYQRPDQMYVNIDPTASSLSGWSGVLRLRRNSGSVRLDASAAATSPGYEINDVGFQPLADRIAVETTLSWRKSSPDRLTRRRSISFSKSYAWNFGKHEQEDAWTTNASITFLNYWYVSANASLRLRSLDDHLTRGGVLSPFLLSGEDSV